MATKRRKRNLRLTVARIPSRWTPARVTRLKSGQIQLRIGGHGK